MKVSIVDEEFWLEDEFLATPRFVYLFESQKWPTVRCGTCTNRVGNQVVASTDTSLLVMVLLIHNSHHNEKVKCCIRLSTYSNFILFSVARGRDFTPCSFYDHGYLFKSVVSIMWERTDDT